MKKIAKKSKKIQKQKTPLISKKTITLIVLLILTIAIPITVLALQRVQNIRPQAAAVPSIPNSQICDGQSNAFGAIVDPQPVTEGQEVTFRLNDETDSVDVDKNNFGNGVISSTCKQNGNAVTCTAKGNFKNGEKTSTSTWVYKAVTGDKQLCKYTVNDDVSGKKPTTTPKPTPTARAQAACNGKIETACTVDNKPRLLISYDLRGGIDGSCDVIIDDLSQGDKRVSLTSKCTNRSQFALDTLNGQALKNGTQYKLVIKNGSTCADYTVKGQVTTNCNGGEKNPTPTTKNTGLPTPTVVTPKNVNAQPQRTDVISAIANTFQELMSNF